MERTLTPPPYALDALAPAYSRETMDYHWGKHHKAYVDKLNELQAGTEFENMPPVFLLAMFTLQSQNPVQTSRSLGLLL